MRKALFASAAMLGLAVTGAAFAQAMTPEDYLKQAQQEVRQHHPNRALMAVNNAENELVQTQAPNEARSTRDVGEPTIYDQIGGAREAIQQQHWRQAEIYLSSAMTHASAEIPGPAAASGTNPAQ